MKKFEITIKVKRIRIPYALGVSIYKWTIIHKVTATIINNPSNFNYFTIIQN